MIAVSRKPFRQLSCNSNTERACENEVKVLGYRSEKR